MGVHIVGAHAADLVHEAAMAMQVGATVTQMAEMIHAHPTLSEGMMEAAEDVEGKAIHQARKRTTIMWQSLLLKLGMFAATMGVVFWIGWTLPTSFDREHDFATESVEGPKAEIVSDSRRVTTVSPSPVALLSDQPSTLLLRNNLTRAYSI